MFKNYVLIQPATHKWGEEYFVDHNLTLPTTTDTASEAMHFATAREAYEYGGTNDLLDWKVGLR